MRRLWTVVLFPSVILSVGCDGCGRDPLVDNQFAIAVEVCKGGELAEGKGGTDDCTLSFDNSALTVRANRNIKLYNVGEEDLTINGYDVDASSDPAFSVEYVPTTIKPGATAEMVVSFRPLLENQVGGKITLKTNAKNTPNPDDGNVVINLNGTGFNDGLPDLQVTVLSGDDEESCCELGLVAVGSTANCRIKLTNNGTRGVVLDEVAFDAAFSTSGAWAPVGALPTPGNHEEEDNFTIAPGATTVISFKFTPTDEVQSQARVFIRSNSPRSCGPIGTFISGVCAPQSYLNPCPTQEVGRVTVDLRGKGASPPLCKARIKSVNGQTEFDPRLIEPLDDVVLTAEDSTPAEDGLSITSYHWEIRGRPSGSTVRLDNPDSPTPRFVFDNSSTNSIFGLDVVGDYSVRCEAVDSQGTSSVNDGEAIVNISATPSEAIHLQLVWDSPETDVDLHMVREVAGAFRAGTEDDCYYGNCKNGGPIWDSASGEGEGGNPKLDVDDLYGYGPENSNINEPVAGRYKALVHYFSDHGNGSTVATLRVYIYGNLVAEYFKLFDSGDCWDVGNVVWTPGGAPDWEEMDSLNQTSCNSF
jgi:hypothetical protein